MSNHDVETGKLVAGRTGRRNALPDVLSLAHASCGTEDLTQALQQLQTTSTSMLQYYMRTLALHSTHSLHKS